MPVNDYNKKKALEVTSQNDSGSTQDKAQPVLLVGGDDSTTGTGDIIVDFTNIAGPEDIAVYDQNGNLLDYEIESLDTTAETATLWAYNSWIRDDSVQAQIAYGDNSANVDRQNVTGTWGNTGQNALMVQHLNGNAIDSTSNNNDGTINGPVQTTGQFADAYSFDGTDDLIDFGDDDQFSFTDGSNDQPFSISMWVNVTDVDEFPTLISKAGGAGSGEYYILIDNDGQMFAAIIDDSNSSWQRRTTNDGAITQNEWHHVVMTYSGSGGSSGIDLYIDGEIAGTADSNSGTYDGMENTSQELEFGRREGDNTSHDGLLDETKIISKEISQEEIQAEYDASPKGGQVYFSQQAAEQTATTNTTTAGYDAAVAERNETTAEYDAAVKETGKTETTHYDAAIQETNLTTTSDYDAAVASRFEQPATYDAALQNNNQTVTADYDAVVAAGRPGAVTVQIEGQEIKTFTDIEIEKRLNEVDTFSFQAFITDSNDRSLINEGNDVKIFEGVNNLLFKGRLTEVEYKSNFRAKCEGDGMEVKLLNRKTERETFNNNGDDIVKSVVSSNILSYGDIESAPQVNVRFDHDNKARAVAGVANATGYDWFVDQELADDFDTDYLNFVADAGSQLIRESADFEDNTTSFFNGGSVTSTDPLQGTYSLEVVPSGEFDTGSTRHSFTNISEGPVVIETDIRPEGTFSGADNLSNIRIEVGTNVELDFQYDTGQIEFGEDAKPFSTGTAYTLKFVVTPEKDEVEAYVDGSFLGDEPLSDDSVDYFEITASDFSNTGSVEKAVIDNYSITNDPDNSRLFDIGGNARMVDRDKDESFVANDITLLGRGDGINQLEAKVFAATTKYTDTTQVINENESTSFTVDDTTQLGSTGDSLTVRVGTEPIDVTISDSTTLSIDSRAVNDYNGDGTEAIKHFENIRVWLVENKTQSIGPFTPENKSTAESGSSIDTFGVKEQRVTDKTIVDISTLEKTADLELKNRFEDVFRLQIDASEPRVTENLQLGDTVTVQDLTAMDVDDQFDIVGFDIMRSSSEEGTILHLANRPRRLTERLSDIESDRNTLNAHMQGATNIDSQNFNDNADNNNPLSADLRIPDDAVAVNKTEVTFKREPFRGYVKNQDHNHDVEIGTVSGDSVGQTGFENITEDTDEISIAETNNNNDFTALANGGRYELFFDTVSTTGSDTVIYASLETDGSGGEPIDVVLRYRSGAQVDPIRVERTQTNAEGNVAFTISGPDDIFDALGEDLNDVYVEWVNRSDKDLVFDRDSFVTYLTWDHAHSIDIGTKTSKEAGSPAYGLFQPSSEPDIDVDLVVDGTTVQTFTDVSVGDEIDSVRIEQALDEPIAGEYHDIELIPEDTGGGNDGRSRLNATVYNKVFIESTL